LPSAIKNDLGGCKNVQFAFFGWLVLSSVFMQQKKATIKGTLTYYWIFAPKYNAFCKRKKKTQKNR
jgi:hypothetical protein